MGFIIVNLIILNKKTWEMTNDFPFVNRKFLSRKERSFYYAQSSETLYIQKCES